MSAVVALAGPAALAGALVAAAALLAVPGRAHLPSVRRPVGRAGPTPPWWRRRARWCGVLAPPLAVATISPPVAVVAALAAAAVVGGARLVAARRGERAAALRRRRVVDLCETLQAELSAGQPPTAALDHAVAEWPFAGPAARAAGTGGDVAAALRELAAAAPGAESLRILAAAWQVAHRTGHGLADSLGRVAADLRAREDTRRVVAGELASARATARVLAALPLFALVVAGGAGAGAGPVRFLLTEPLGLGCLAAGLALEYAGLAWIEALARDVDRLS